MTEQPKRRNWWMWAALFFMCLSVIYTIKSKRAYEELASRDAKEHEERTIWHNQELRKDREIALSDTLLNTVKAWADSALHAKDSVIEHRENRVALLKRRWMPVQAIIEADSLELTRAQLENRDSTIDLQVLTIGELKAKYNIADSADRIEDAAFERKIKAYNVYSTAVVHQRDSAAIAGRKLEKKFRRQRTKERILEGLIVVGVVILAL